MEQEVKKIVTDLVTLAIRTNNVVIQGSFPGAISDQVNALLRMCNEIHDEYVALDGTSDGGSDSSGTSDGNAV